MRANRLDLARKAFVKAVFSEERTLRNSMKVQVNGEAYSLKQGETIAALVERLQVKEPYAVEVNGAIAPRSEHAFWVLNEADRIEIVGAVGGG